MLRKTVRSDAAALLIAVLISSGGVCRAAQPAEEWRDAVYDETAAEGIDGIGADLSHLSEGYASFRAESDRKLKIQLVRGEDRYHYDLPGDGRIVVCPLNMGSGRYTFRVLENIAGDRYAVIWSESREAELLSEYEPFLRPSALVNYSRESACVELAEKLTENCATDVEKVSEIYNYLVAELRYDYQKAKTVKSGYLPDPDSVLEEKKGICFDYASLAAAMLRSRGVPCRLVTGYVEPDGVYHAWNEIYLKEKGWITVKIKVKGMLWKHVDITFAANGVEPSRTDNQGLYTKRYTY